MTKEENAKRLASCDLHEFDWRGDLRRHKEWREKAGVILGSISPALAVTCRCKKCGGVVLLAHAIPYMDAVEHMKAKAEKEATT